MTSLQTKLQSNLWKYALLLIANKRLFVAILGVYYLTVPGVTPQGIGIILIAGTVAGFIFEIPSGYASDKLGHKQTLVVARTLMLISTVCFLVADSLTLLILAAVVMSMAHAFHSGTGTAFMHETLQGLGKEDQYARIMGKISSIGFAIPIVFMVVVPFLVGISWELPFLVALVMDAMGLFAAIFLVVPPVPPEHIEEIGVTNFRQVMQEGRRLHFFIFALFSGIVSGVLFGVGGFRGPYQAMLGIPVIYFGVFFGIGRAGASLLLAYGGKFKEKLTLSSFYLFQLLLNAICIFILALVPNPWVVVLAFVIINAFQWGLNEIDTGFMLNIIKTSKFKATLLSTSAQIDQIISGVTSFGMGFLIQRFSYQHGFLSLGILFVVVLTPLYIYILRSKKLTPLLKSE